MVPHLSLIYFFMFDFMFLCLIFILMGTCNLKYVFFLLFKVSEGYRIALKSVRFLNLRAKKYPYDIWSKLWYIFQHYVLTLLYLTVRCIMCWLILDNLIFDDLLNAEILYRYCWIMIYVLSFNYCFIVIWDLWIKFVDQSKFVMIRLLCCYFSVVAANFPSYGGIPSCEVLTCIIKLNYLNF